MVRRNWLLDGVPAISGEQYYKTGNAITAIGYQREQESVTQLKGPSIPTVVIYILPVKR